MPKDYTVACYYFPNYHIDPRNETDHGPGWTEWELVKRAEPRFAGHRQPLVPLCYLIDPSIGFEQCQLVMLDHSQCSVLGTVGSRCHGQHLIWIDQAPEHRAVIQTVHYLQHQRLPVELNFVVCCVVQHHPKHSPR